jgi:hypothetical protein
VHLHVDAIKHNAEIAVRELLKSIGSKNPGKPLKCSDFMDATEIKAYVGQLSTLELEVADVKAHSTKHIHVNTIKAWPGPTT